MGTGPEVTSGFDLALTELDDGFLVRSGSPAGEHLAAGAAARNRRATGRRPCRRRGAARAVIGVPVTAWRAARAAPGSSWPGHHTSNKHQNQLSDPSQPGTTNRTSPCKSCAVPRSARDRDARRQRDLDEPGGVRPAQGRTDHLWDRGASISRRRSRRPATRGTSRKTAAITRPRTSRARSRHGSSSSSTSWRTPASAGRHGPTAWSAPV